MNNTKFQIIEIKTGNKKIILIKKLPNNDLLIINNLGEIIIYDNILFTQKSIINDYKNKTINSFIISKQEKKFIFSFNNNISIINYFQNENKIISKEEILKAHDNNILEIIELSNLNLCSSGGNLIKIWKKVSNNKYQNLIILDSNCEYITSLIEINDKEIFSGLGLNSKIIFWNVDFWNFQTINKINLFLTNNCACLLNKNIFCVCCKDFYSFILINLENKEIIKKIFFNVPQTKILKNFDNYHLINKLSNEYIICGCYTTDDLKSCSNRTMIKVFKFNNEKLEFKLIDEIYYPHKRVIKDIIEFKNQKFITFSYQNDLKIWDLFNKNN
jgi:WD40 repeat protein